MTMGSRCGKRCVESNCISGLPKESSRVVDLRNCLAMVPSDERERTWLLEFVRCYIDVRVTWSRASPVLRGQLRKEEHRASGLIPM